MKKKLMIFGSYVLVAVLATVVTLTTVYFTVPGMEQTKLEQLQALIEERFVGDADAVVLEDAAANAMVKATADRWSYYIPASEYETYREQEMEAKDLLIDFEQRYPKVVNENNLAAIIAQARKKKAQQSIE